MPHGGDAARREGRGHWCRRHCAVVSGPATTASTAPPPPGGCGKPPVRQRPMGGATRTAGRAPAFPRHRTGSANLKNHSGGHTLCHCLLVIALTDDKDRLIGSAPHGSDSPCGSRHVVPTLTAHLRTACRGAMAHLVSVAPYDGCRDTHPAVITGQSRPEPAPDPRSEIIRRGTGPAPRPGRTWLRPRKNRRVPGEVRTGPMRVITPVSSLPAPADREVACSPMTLTEVVRP